MSEHYDTDIQAMKDYEALNADTALQLNKAKQEIERLRAENEKLKECIAEWQKDSALNGRW
jgi:FtsZ-binding cell division protein ZapB